jgi:hypothetical protein
MELSGTTRQFPSFYLTILFPLSVSGKLTGTLSGFITCVKPAPFGLLCAWREVPILRQQSQLLRSKKEVLDIADPQQVPTPEADRSARTSDVVARVPSTRWLKKDKAKTK